MKKKIGLLFSQSGTTSIVEMGQLRACLLAIEEINRQGGLQFEPVIGDAKSDPHMAGKEANRLFSEAGIDFLVGCYTSACRKAVIPVLYQFDGLMVYPTLYEGEEKHPNIFYCGAVPNQQIEPMLSWVISRISNKFALIGSDYIYPHSTNKQVKDWVLAAKGTVVTENYFPLGCVEFEPFFRELERFTKFNTGLVVFSTIVGTSIISFYREYRKRKIPFPIVSPITSEIEIELMGKSAAAGHYCTSAYFQNIQNTLNTRFIDSFNRRFGQKPISREIASSYEAIYLLNETYKQLPQRQLSKKREFERIRENLKTLTYNGLQGKIIMDPDLQQLWQWSRIGRIQPDGIIDIEWSSSGPIPPKPTMVSGPITIEAKTRLPKEWNFGSLIGKHQRFLECVDLAKIASKTPANVLITGKSGTGKEVFARAIHKSSPRNRKSFVPINCAAIPRDLIASELFGYEEGSFTGAKKGGKIGKFELSDKGTLFLDEIGEMPLDLQTHLLRVIEEKEFYRIGGCKPIRVDVRIIAATSRDLPQEIAFNGTFRSDLYYRLNVFYIELPTLQERREDIPLLARYFLNKLNTANRTNKFFNPECRKLFWYYSWPGNVRELENVVERSYYVALESKCISGRHIPKRILKYVNDIHKGSKRDKVYSQPHGMLSIADPYDIESTRTDADLIDTNALQSKKPIDTSEKQLIIMAIEKAGYNLSLASRLLGISRSTIYRKVKKYDIALTPDWEQEEDHVTS